MTIWKHQVAKHLEHVAVTALAFLGLNWINEALFAQLEHSAGINWVFIPAGIRLLATLLFGIAGFEGLLLAGFYLNFHHFAFDNDFRALSGAVAGAGGPFLAWLFAKHWFDLRPHLAGLTVPRLIFIGLLCGLVSPICHHALSWVQTGLVDWGALGVMISGDLTGILVVLGIARGVIALAGRGDPGADLIRRWTA